VEKTPAWIQDHIDGTPAEAPASPIALDGTVTPPPVESDGVAPDDGGTLTPSSKTPWVTLGVSKRKYQDMKRHFSPASPRPRGLIPLPSSPGADSSAPVLSPNEEKRALCTTLLTQYGKNKSVAVGWTVLEVTDTPDLFDAWHSVVGPLLKRTKVQLLRGEPPRLEAGALLLTLEIPDLTDSEDAEDAEDAAGDD